MNTRDFSFFALGAILGIGLTLLFQKWNSITKFIRKQGGTLYRIPYRGGLPIKRHRVRTIPEDGKRIWPPMHPGGRPRDALSSGDYSSVTEILPLLRRARKAKENGKLAEFCKRVNVPETTIRNWLDRYESKIPN